MPAVKDEVKAKGNGKAPEDGDEDEVDRFEIPEDLSELDDASLEDVTGRTQRAMDSMRETFSAQAEEGGSPSEAELQQARDLRTALDGLKAEQASRDAAAQQRREEMAATLADPTDEEQASAETETEGEGSPGGDAPADESAPSGDGPEGTEPSDLVQAGVRRGPLKVEVGLRKPTLNPTLAEIAKRAGRASELEDNRPDIVINAAADVPGFANGQPIVTLDDLASAANARVKNMGVTMGTPQFVPLASIKREFPTILDADAQTPQQMFEAIEEMVSPHRDQEGGMEALVAAGGWCAPSEIRYDFFQISEVAGLLDLPTFGVNRGGIRFPINGGLSLYDFLGLANAPASGLATNATMPWSWSEADDIAAATGTTPTKVCLRPPCPNFDEQRLGLFGICVTAGNLTEDAYPELIRHFIAQTVVSHARVINRRLLLTAAAMGTATTPTVSGETAFNAWLGGLELNAVDYREKHGMRDTAVLEVVAPSWARGVLRSDVAKKNGFERFDASDQYLTAQLDARRVRVQWVQDWQTRLATGIAPVGGAIPTNWPATAQVMMYAPGTVGRGNGMRLDLGVTRDSVLNADNDHTAAWSEESTLLAKLGHEVRLLTLNTVAGGATGQQAAMTGA